jgi:hypothetical protein
MRHPNQGDVMLTVRTLTIVMTAALLLTAGPVRTAHADNCNDDRFPCPVVAEPATQETADVPVAPSAQPRKKMKRDARRDEKERGRSERDAARAPSRARAAKSADREPEEDAFPRRDASPQRDESPVNVLQQVAAPKKVGTALPKSLNDEVDRNESQVASAAAAWLVLPATDGIGDGAQSLQDVNQDANAEGPVATPVALPADGTPAADPGAVTMFAGTPTPAPAESTWLGYLFMTLGGALAAASTVRYLLV